MASVSDIAQPPVPPLIAVRPSWRGWMHAVAFGVAIPAGALLVLSASGAMARVGSSVYAVSLLAAFGLSAAYHRLARSTRAIAVMRRLDHSTIYVLIAGTYTPVCLIAMPPEWGIPVLCVVWAGAVTGILMKVLAFDRRGWQIASYALYPILGWLAVIAAPAMVRSLTTVELSLIVAGGLLYSIGFPVLLLRRPNPWPLTFGYHEVWHTFTIAAGVCHFTAVAMLVR